MNRKDTFDGVTCPVGDDGSDDGEYL